MSKEKKINQNLIHHQDNVKRIDNEVKVEVSNIFLNKFYRFDAQLEINR